MFFGITIATIGILDLLALGGIAVMMMVEAKGIGFAAAVIGVFVALALGVWLVPEGAWVAVAQAGREGIGPIIDGKVWIPHPPGVAAILAIVTGAIIILLLLALAISMMIGAIIGKHSTITSWPAAQEQSFAPFNQRVSSSHSQAMIFAICGGALVFFSAVGIYVGVEPEMRDIGKSMNMSNLTKKPKPAAPAPTPDQPKTDAPKTDAPKTDAPKTDKTDAPKADAPKADAPKAEAPPPAKK